MDRTLLDLHAQAQQLYQIAVEAAQPKHTLPRAFESFVPQLKDAIRQSKHHRWHLFGFGKAAYDMAQSTLEIPHLKMPVNAATIITDTPPKQTQSDIDVLLADHPIPTQRSIDATTQFIHRLKHVPRNEPIVTLISGGGSAMLCLPRPEITLAAKQATTGTNIADVQVLSHIF